jgi:hypothetical protein
MRMGCLKTKEYRGRHGLWMSKARLVITAWHRVTDPIVLAAFRAALAKHARPALHPKRPSYPANKQTPKP